MKCLLTKILTVFLLLFVLGLQKAKAESVVYFFFDCRFWIKEYPFTINGEQAFSLLPNGKPVVEGGAVLYDMVMRKVIFKHSGSYVVSTGYMYKDVSRDVSLNLNVEDNETYYVLINSSLKKPFYMELIDEKKGLNLLKKAKKKYTINKDFIYDGK